MEHSYSINLKERQTVYFWLAIIACGVSVLIAKLLVLVAWTPPVWLDVPGAFTLFGLLCLWFDKHLWRLRPVRALGISTPILAGNWAGSSRSSFDGYGSESPLSATIHQTWTRISICIETRESRSKSSVAAINVGIENSIVYCFENQPKVTAPDSMHAHSGTATLSITANRLEGEYYSGRDRQNQGTISLERTEPT